MSVNMNNPQTRPLTDIEKHVLSFVRDNRMDSEEVINTLCGWDDAQARAEVSAAIAYLLFGSGDLNTLEDRTLVTKGLF